MESMGMGYRHIYSSNASYVDYDAMEEDILIEKLMSNYGMESTNKIPAREMRLHDSTATFENKIDFSSIGLEDANDTVKVRSVTGNVLLRKR